MMIAVGRDGRRVVAKIHCQHVSTHRDGPLLNTILYR
jgi:hypothetical protein